MNNLLFTAFGTGGLVLLLIGLRYLSDRAVAGMGPRERERFDKETGEIISDGW